MLGSAFFYIVGSFIYAVTFVLGKIVYFLPSQFFDAIDYAIAKLWVLDIVFPVADLIQAVAALMIFFGIWYTFRLVMWAVKFLPWVGNAVSNPGKISDDPHARYMAEINALNAGNKKYN